MEFSKQFIEEQMKQYIQDSEDYGEFDDIPVITEVFTGFNNLLLENTSDRISTNMLQEHANGLDSIPKEIFEDFVLYMQINDLDSQLL